MSGMITRWFLGMVVGSTVGSAMALGANCSYAQITPDATLPNNSTVKLEGNIRTIEGGTRAGGNLFHSFKEFSVPTGGTAFFNNATDIQNIISRVTGGSVSNIDGIIRTLGTANLFLINPNGIVFGANASLNVGGSFVATTANAIQFGNQGFFSASAPNNPELLTVNPNALLFNQIRAASIQNNSVADAGLNPSSKFTVNGLRVPDGRSLLLVGGDINMDGGGLYAFGGRVELGGLAGAGTVGLNEDGNNLSLSFPNSVERSDVSLSNGANVAVIADNGGSIAVNARNLEMTGGSILIAGIESGLGSDNSKAGNIEVNATGAINLSGGSISNDVLAEANGQGGDVNISASTLQVESGLQVSTSTSGKGKAGDLTIKTNTLLVKDGAQVGSTTLGSGRGGTLTVNAQDVQLIGTSVDGQPSGLFTLAQRNSTGDAGDLTIKTNTLLVQDGAQVKSTTFGSGNSGNLSVNAFDVQVIGTRSDGQPSELSADAQRNSTGSSGDLTIKTNTLLVKDGAQVTSGTFGSGRGGILTVDAQDVQLIGTSAYVSGLFTSADVKSKGDAGDLMIKTNTLLVKDGAQVSANTFGSGRGGTLTVDAQDVQLIGTSANGVSASALLAAADVNSTGSAGDLTIKTNTLLVKDGAQIGSATLGSGRGGTLTVNAQDVQLIGISANGQIASALSTSTERNSTEDGDAGDLTIKTNTLLVKDGAQVTNGTFGSGRGGTLTVDAQDVQLIGRSNDGRARSGLYASAQPNSTGDAGDLTIKTHTLLVKDGAGITVQSLGTGTAGNMTLNARSIRLDNLALLTANTQSAKVDPNREQATININSRDLIMRRGSNIRTNATGENVIGGNININSDIIAAIENSDISANSANYRGGKVKITTQGIFGTQFRDAPTSKSDITATGGSPEFSGTVQINTLGIDPTQGLVSLPVIPVDTKVAQGCYAGGSQAQSEFIITGRGGLPPNPGEPLSTDAVSVNLVTLENQEARHHQRNRATQSQSHTREHSHKINSANPPTQIVEAQGWIVNKNGDVELVAFAPTATPHNPLFNPASCQRERK